MREENHVPGEGGKESSRAVHVRSHRDILDLIAVDGGKPTLSAKGSVTDEYGTSKSPAQVICPTENAPKVSLMSRVPAEQRREQLIEATIQLAIDEGLAAASVRRIADQANVSLGVVHYCFSSKEALLNAVAESFVKPILGPIAKAIEESDEVGLAATGKAAFDAFWNVTRETPGRQLLSYELTAWSIRGDGEAARLLYKTYTEVIEGFIIQGLGLHDNAYLPMRTLARMVLAVIDGVSLAWLVDRDDELAGQLLQAFLATLVPVVERLRDMGGADGPLQVGDGVTPAEPDDEAQGTDQDT